MAKRSNITGNKDGINGRNETYQVNGATVFRKALIKQIESGDWPGYHIYTRSGQKYVRDNPDGSQKDNVNK